ncbi:probable protein phosphatase 2C 11 isoform X3 [Vigna angularis]|uniref:probable protein phosphatase 2C 11 isoform X3 n=1 Tax=Phaseolus angularis TaxID=3914 RepID=UPI0022B37AF7|nr:probable protein phosphatase 2C 11 isoform X3 [Vigna angularis]
MISNSDPVEPLTAAAATSAVAVTASSSAEGQPAPPATPNIVMSSKDHDSLFSGGGIRLFLSSFLSGSRSGRFSYGYSSFKGKRSSMEDFFETTISEVDGQMVAFFGVFDVEAFKQTDIDYLNEEKGHQRDAGSTASTAMLLGDRIVVANVGDSRVVASRAGSAIPLSIDHKPDRSDERQRIEKAGGFIIWAGTWRVGGVLAVSRAFGDKLLKPYVVADPEIQEEEIDGVDFIIIASDGLWNVISNKEAVSLVQNITDAEVASRELIKEAYARGSSDNITSVVVRFDIS